MRPIACPVTPNDQIANSWNTWRSCPWRGGISRVYGAEKHPRLSKRTRPFRPASSANNESGSEEHLWPDWVHRFIKANNIQLGGLRVQEGTGPEMIQDDLEITINTVCHACNNTWIARRVEDKNRTRFLLMLQKNTISVDPGGMKIIAEWAVLRAIMQDSKKPSLGNDNFYTREERTAMREHLKIPARTRVWFGALVGFHLGSHGTDFTIEAVQTDGSKVRIGTGCANTEYYMGYLIAQVVTEHLYSQYQALGIAQGRRRRESATRGFIQIYPKRRELKKFDWPTTPFTNGGPNGVGYLLHRWRQGEKVSMVTKDSKRPFTASPLVALLPQVTAHRRPPLPLWILLIDLVVRIVDGHDSVLQNGMSSSLNSTACAKNLYLLSIFSREGSSQRGRVARRGP